MKVIVLQGKTNSGKSSSLKYCFIEMLKDRRFTLLWKSRKQYDDNNAIIKDIEDNWQNDTGTYIRDISGVFEYKGKKIFIVTIGDSIEDIKNQLRNRMYKYDIDLFICSRHDNNDIIKELADIVTLTDNDVIQISKEHVSGGLTKFVEANRTTGVKIYKKINELLS